MIDWCEKLRERNGRETKGGMNNLHLARGRPLIVSALLGYPDQYMMMMKSEDPPPL